jgi:beta-glucosidase
MVSSWLSVAPDALYWVPKLMSKLWGVKNIYITENGCSAADTLTPEGRVLDTDRIFYLRAYLTEMQRATSEGVPIRGYFLWSLLDNFEWSRGYSERFGLVYVDYESQKRTPKLSAEYYRQTIKNNRLV